KIYATLDILCKCFVHQDEIYSASGLSCVATAPSERGKGYGKMLVTSAYQLIKQNNSDIGIFTCDTYLEKFYTGCGWNTLENTHLIGGTPKEPFSSEQFDKVTLISFFSNKAQKNAHTFNNCNIELYPGDIDRLW
ncbi:GNAT family N-acetyltransferase, partial [Zooshikella harenae]